MKNGNQKIKTEITKYTNMRPVDFHSNKTHQISDTEH